MGRRSSYDENALYTCMKISKNIKYVKWSIVPTLSQGYFFKALCVYVYVCVLCGICHMCRCLKRLGASGLLKLELQELMSLPT